ncbi:MAG: XisH family protein [Acidobacteriota bacterium]
MARRDKIHDAVKNALIKDGWTITADPYEIKYKRVKLQADLAADRPIAADRGEEKIVVEIKSFLSLSPIHELQAALGQYQMYLAFLESTAPERRLFLAVSQQIWEELFLLEAIQDLIARWELRLFVVDLKAEEILLWKK